MKFTRNYLTREQRLIEIIKTVTGSQSLGDDCAILAGGQLVTSDMLVEGRHFLLDLTDFHSLGWKCMAVNLSDIAAMGGSPTFAIVDIAWPSSFSDEEFQALYSGLQECAARFNTQIVGGDITGSEKLVCAVTVSGQSPSSGAILRSGARPGMLLVSTGNFGASACGLDKLQQLLKRSMECSVSEDSSLECSVRRRIESVKAAIELAQTCYPVQRHLRPMPRMESASKLVNCLRSGGALMDTSDGLADAALQIARMSGVSIELDLALIPIHAQTRELAQESGEPILDLVLYGGEDFELFACIDPLDWERLSADAVVLNDVDGKSIDSNFTVIGKTLVGDEVFVVDENGEKFAVENNRTYQHFSS